MHAHSFEDLMDLKSLEDGAAISTDFPHLLQILALHLMLSAY